METFGLRDLEERRVERLGVDEAELVDDRAEETARAQTERLRLHGQIRPHQSEMIAPRSPSPVKLEATGEASIACVDERVRGRCGRERADCRGGGHGDHSTGKRLGLLPMGGHTKPDLSTTDRASMWGRALITTHKTQTQKQTPKKSSIAAGRRPSPLLFA